MIHLILAIIGLSPVLYQNNDNVLLASIGASYTEYGHSIVSLRVMNNSPMNIRSANLRIIFLDKDERVITTLDKRITGLYAGSSKISEMRTIGRAIDFKISINSISPDLPFELKTINLNKTNSEDGPKEPVSDKQDIKTFPIASNNLGAKVNSWNGLTKTHATLDDPKSTLYNLDKSLVPSVLEGFECRVIADDESGIVYKVVFEKSIDENISGSEFQRLRKILDTKYQVKFSNVTKIKSEALGSNLTFLEDFVEQNGKDPLFITYEYPDNNDIQINLDKDITIRKVNAVRVTYSVKALSTMVEERIKQEKKNKSLEEENKRKNLSKEL